MDPNKTANDCQMWIVDYDVSVLAHAVTIVIFFSVSMILLCFNMCCFPCVDKRPVAMCMCYVPAVIFSAVGFFMFLAYFVGDSRFCERHTVTYRPVACQNLTAAQDMNKCNASERVVGVSSGFFAVFLIWGIVRIVGPKMAGAAILSVVEGMEQSTVDAIRKTGSTLKRAMQHNKVKNDFEDDGEAPLAPETAAERLRNTLRETHYEPSASRRADYHDAVYGNEYMRSLTRN